MINGIEITEKNFNTLGDDEKIETIFENVLMIKKYLIAQPALCADLMDDKIKTNDKTRRKFNIGLGGGSGAAIVAAFEAIKSLFFK